MEAGKMIGNIGQNIQQGIATLQVHHNKIDDPVRAQDGANEKITTPADKITLRGNSPEALTYSDTKALNGNEGDKYGLLRSLVVDLLRQQGINTRITLENPEKSEIDLATITPEKAKDLVSDDGYFGVEKTSERIFKFAVSISGGDPSRIDAIKEGIDKGFQDAQKIFGGTLPDISHDTYNAVMEKLDKWVKEAQPEASSS